MKQKKEQGKEDEDSRAERAMAVGWGKFPACSGLKVQ